jgi:putative nucleotidyltransferase with HDIG domain
VETPAAAPPPPAAEGKVRALIQALDVVVSLIETDDPYFAGYSHRVAELAGEVAQRLDLGADAREEIEIAALLHDVGKMALEPAILLHGGTLAESEAMRMREHVHWGERLIEHIEFPWRVRDIVRHHHERYDGSGYPDHLQGRAIPVGARIIAAVDAYVAMVSPRRHRQALGDEAAREDLTRSSGTQLDPEVVEILLRVVVERSAQASGGARPRIAIVDPDPLFQRLVRLRLTTEGLDVEGRQKIEDIEPLLRAGETSLLLIDAASAGVAMVEAARAAASAAGHPQVPLAVMSDQDDRGLRRECLRLGVEDYISKSDDLEDIVARIKNILVRERRRSAPVVTVAEEGLVGSLETMNLPEIVQFLALGQKSARVALAASEGEGDVWMVAGRLIHASCGALTGEPALFEMLRWRDGRFRINHGVASPARTIEGDTMALLLEGMRLRDEAAAGMDP